MSKSPTDPLPAPLMLLAPLPFVLAACLPVGFELHADADEYLTLGAAYAAAESQAMMAGSVDGNARETASGRVP